MVSEFCLSAVLALQLSVSVIALTSGEFDFYEDKTAYTNMDVRKPQTISYQPESQSFGPENPGRADYLSKLTARRDSPVEYEQTRQVKALSRLGLPYSFGRKDSFRLRMNGSHIYNALPPAKKTDMVTTVEKFRQMRQQQQKQQQQRRLASVVPLEGRQIFHKEQANCGDHCTTSVNGSSHGDHVGGSSGKNHSLLIASQVEQIIQKDKMRSKQATKKLGNISRISRHLFPHEYSLETKRNHLLKVRPMVKKTVGQTVCSLPLIPNSSILSSQACQYCPSGPSQDSIPIYWHPAVTTFGNESPDTRVHQPTNVKRKVTSQIEQWLDDDSVGTCRYDGFIMGRNAYQQIDREDVNNASHTRSLISLPAITEYPALELVCLKCLDLEKQQQPNKIHSHSDTDVYNKRIAVLYTNGDSRHVASDDAKIRAKKQHEQSIKKGLTNDNIRHTEDEADNENKDFIVTSFSNFSENHGLDYHHRNDSAKPPRRSNGLRKGTKAQTNLSDNGDNYPETRDCRVLDPGTEEIRSRPRKINIVIDIPDISPRSPTPDPGTCSMELTEEPTPVIKDAAAGATVLTRSRHTFSRQVN